ncbi:MAG: hypothetical protein NT066_06910, partial [Candidatus Omnitrophica bacterium]|nr:hypothetical protein [Candidatus Omnitrophota bacterium]
MTWRSQAYLRWGTVITPPLAMGINPELIATHKIEKANGGATYGGEIDRPLDTLLVYMPFYTTARTEGRSDFVQLYPLALPLYGHIRTGIVDKSGQVKADNITPANEIFFNLDRNQQVSVFGQLARVQNANQDVFLTYNKIDEQGVDTKKVQDAISKRIWSDTGAVIDRPALDYIKLRTGLENETKIQRALSDGLKGPATNAAQKFYEISLRADFTKLRDLHVISKNLVRATTGSSLEVGLHLNEQGRWEAELRAFFPGSSIEGIHCGYEHDTRPLPFEKGTDYKLVVENGKPYAVRGNQKIELAEAHSLRGHPGQLIEEIGRWHLIVGDREKFISDKYVKVIKRQDGSMHLIFGHGGEPMWLGKNFGVWGDENSTIKFTSEGADIQNAWGVHKANGTTIVGKIFNNELSQVKFWERANAPAQEGNEYYGIALARGEDSSRWFSLEQLQHNSQPLYMTHYKNGGNEALIQGYKDEARGVLVTTDSSNPSVKPESIPLRGIKDLTPVKDISFGDRSGASYDYAGYIRNLATGRVTNLFRLEINKDTPYL